MTLDNAMIESLLAPPTSRVAGPARLAHHDRAHERDRRISRDVARPPTPTRRLGMLRPAEFEIGTRARPARTRRKLRRFRGLI
jgi:hypothetical protein